ncbi:unnamed protein product [Brachionus calyciflorus]|uniref:Uncharacterized protein n=1 Tax=Brachionus calyciflorus TaxID=104777 RepID=A0A813TUL6_9BILA|nr:unnamed protein product [Brachionus calyciflorus]
MFPYFEKNLTSMEQGIKFNAEKISKRHQSSTQTGSKQSLEKKENAKFEASKIVDVTIETGRKISRLEQNLLKKQINKSIINFNKVISQTNEINSAQNRIKLNKELENTKESDSSNEIPDKSNHNKTCSNGNLTKGTSTPNLNRQKMENKWSEDDLKTVREKIMNKLNEIKANSVTDLTPNKNIYIAFKIDLTDPNQKPITTKSRPLPYHLKQKVREELDRQLKAGIIRKSKSEWSAASRIVDKKDRSTV